MPIDINLLRKDKGGDPDAVRDMLKKRFKDPAMADLVIDLDEKWRKADFAASECNAEKNKINKEVGELVKAKATKEQIAAKKVEVKQRSAEVDVRQDKLKKEASEIALARDKARGPSNRGRSCLRAAVGAALWCPRAVHTPRLRGLT
mgnify:CR=1 FL=1